MDRFLQAVAMVKKGWPYGIFLLLVSGQINAQQVDGMLDKQRRKTREVLAACIAKVGDQLTDTSRSAVQQFALFAPVRDYVSSDQANYIKIRTRYLQELEPPPEALTRLTYTALPDTNFVAKLFLNATYAAVTLSTCLKAEEITGVVQGIVQPQLFQSFGISALESNVAYVFGRQIFAKKLSETAWQIWSANRAYGFRFTIDLREHVVKDIAYSAYMDPAYMQANLSFVDRRTAYGLEQLYLALERTRWNSFSFDLLRTDGADAWQDTVDRKLGDYYQRHQKAFVKARRAVLERLSREKEEPSKSWNIVENVDTASFKGTLTPYAIHPDEMAWQLFSHSNGLARFQVDVEEIGKNALVGFITTAHRERENRWHVQSLAYSLGFAYVWDIQTGVVSEFKMLKRASL
ncbi:hypothetical protein [Sphingobacterium suaedae]|uniref:DUF4835 family protein n=1 Tax=Sphingobacterium suaedae TaxID=1686402 RepID=A0ABW5KMY7_9SPHI